MKIVTDLAAIKPGQMILCEYTAASGAYGAFSNFGTTKKPLITAAGATANGAFYFVCVGYAPNGFLKLIADRVIQTNISWETLNAAGLCASQGKDNTKNNFSPQYIYRLPHSALAAGQAGEWDEILVNYDLDGKVNDKVSFWNLKGIGSWTLNTVAANAAQRIVRGKLAVNDFSNIVSTSVAANVGFRPVLLYNPEGRTFTRGNPDCCLELVNNIRKIQPGQAISCEYTAASNTFGTFANLGEAAKEPISDLAPAAPDGTFYFICVGYTPAGNLKLVADRVIQSSVSWDVLSAAGMCVSSGTPVNISDLPGLSMRLLGTISKAQTTTHQYGEWDAIVSYCDLGGNILPADNDIWNCRTTVSLTMATIIGNPTLRYGRGFQDGVKSIMSQKQYNSATAYANVGFRPVLIVQKDSYYLYLKENDNCYKVVNNSLIKAASEWSELSKEEKIALFLSSGSTTIGKAAVLSSLGKFKILVFVEGKELDKASFNMSAIPPEKLILPKGLISIETFEGVDQVTVTGRYAGQGFCKILVTADLKTYKTLKDGAWEIVDVTDLAAIKETGIDSGSISTITREEWDRFTVEETGIAFAYLPVIENVSDVCEIDALTMQVDLRGTWDMALPGVDYTYNYPRNNTLRVKLLTDGDYKINYSEGTIDV